MKTKPQQSTHAQIISAARAVASELHASKVILFGSFGRGTQTKFSDVDLVFIHQTEERFVERPASFMEALHHRIHGWGIDVLVYTPIEFDQMRQQDNCFIRTITQQGRVIYES
jgi:predicted nucleotidyltransferase